MLEFICGAQECGKSGIIYERARRDAECGKSVYILVPEQYSMYAEHEMISRMGLSAQNKIQILTFSRLCNLVFAKKGPLRMKYADKAGKYMLMRKAINRASGELTLLRGNVKQHGFAKVAESIISEFKRYGVTHDMLDEAAEKTTDNRLKMKLLDLNCIYKRFDEIIGEGYADAEDNLSLIIPKIPHCDFISGVFYVDFFRSFTPVEYEVLSQIMQRADLCVSLCTNTVRENSTVFCSQIHTYNKLKKIAEKLGVPLGKTVFAAEKAYVATEEIEHLKKNYFLPKPSKKSGSIHSVQIYRPNNFYEEVRECARLITRLCRTEGYELNDFLILTGSMSNYESLISPIFEEFGIKYFLDRKVGLTESPLMRTIISVLEILAFGFSYERIITIAKSGYFNCTKDEIDVFENYVLAAGISHRQWNERGDWEYNPDERLFDMQVVNSVKSAIVDKILDLREMFEGRKQVGQICERFTKWLLENEMSKKAEEKINEFSSCGKMEYAEQLRLVWNSFVSVINQMAACMGEDFVTFVEFYEIFTSACGELSVGIVPPTQDKVVISEAERFRSTGNKVVIVLGVNDRVFPSSYMTEGIISDAERIELSDIGVELAPDAYNRQREEQFLIYSVFATAKERLYLFSPMSDKDGKSLGASVIIRKIKDRIFPDIGYIEENEMLEGRENIFGELTTKLLECGGEKKELEAMWNEAYLYFEEIPEYAERLIKTEEMQKNAAIREEMSREIAEKLYGAPLVLSVSKLEKYNSCEFSFFMRYGLLAKERMLSGFEARDMGTFLHAVLCEYFKEKADKNVNYSEIKREECEKEIARLVEKQENEENIYSNNCYHNYIKMRMKSIATATAWKLIRFYSQSELRPKAFELSFGRRGALPPFEIETENGTVFLEGFVDRVDEMTVDDKKYVVITDYKSSEKKLSAELAEAGVRFQPLIYANAVCSAEENIYPAAMLYMHMNDPILKFDEKPSETEIEKGMSDGIKIQGIMLNDPSVANKIEKERENKEAVHFISCDKNSNLDAENMEKWIKNASEKAKKAAESIMNGKIDINPVNMGGFDACAYCPYCDVCGKK